MSQTQPLPRDGAEDRASDLARQWLDSDDVFRARRADVTFICVDAARVRYELSTADRVPPYDRPLCNDLLPMLAVSQHIPSFCQPGQLVCLSPGEGWSSESSQHIHSLLPELPTAVEGAKEDMWSVLGPRLVSAFRPGDPDFEMAKATGMAYLASLEVEGRDEYTSLLSVGPEALMNLKEEFFSNPYWFNGRLNRYMFEYIFLRRKVEDKQLALRSLFQPFARPEDHRDVYMLLGFIDGSQVDPEHSKPASAIVYDFSENIITVHQHRFDSLHSRNNFYHTFIQTAAESANTLDESNSPAGWLKTYLFNNYSVLPPELDTVELMTCLTILQLINQHWKLFFGEGVLSYHGREISPDLAVTKMREYHKELSSRAEMQKQQITLQRPRRVRLRSMINSLAEAVPECPLDIQQVGPTPTTALAWYCERELLDLHEREFEVRELFLIAKKHGDEEAACEAVEFFCCQKTDLETRLKRLEVRSDAEGRMAAEGRTVKEPGKITWAEMFGYS